MKSKSTIVSVITGDIIQSRLTETSLWLPRLKKALSVEGKSPGTWQIYRGDSFQMEVKDPARAMMATLRIKAAIKSIGDLDVRMAVGIGEKKFVSQNIAESDGEAFIYSGETFETLKKAKRNLAIKSSWKDFDRDMNVLLLLASILMDEWSPSSAELVELMIDHPELTQEGLAKKLGLTQPSVSERQNRSHFEAIIEMEKLYREKILKLIAANDSANKITPRPSNR